MRIQVLAVLVSAAALAVPAAVTAQSLGEIAAQQKEKQKQQQKKSGKPAKSYTDEDLRRAGGSVSTPAAEGGSSTPAGAPAAPAAAAATPAAGAQGLEGSETSGADAERDWRTRWDKANAEVARIQSEVDRIQQNFTEIGDNAYNPVSRRLKEQLEDGRKKLAEAQAAVETLDQERRKAGWRQ